MMQSQEKSYAPEPGVSPAPETASGNAPPQAEPPTPPPEPLIPPSEPLRPGREPLTPAPEPVVPAPEPLMPPPAESPGEPPPAAAPGVSIEERLAAAQAKAAQLRDACLRARAELEHIRRRVREDIARAHKYAIESFAEALLPVKDSLEAALTVDTPSVASLKEGVDMTLRQLNAAFDKNRLTEINPRPGDKLDPARHQAISMEAADQGANTIVSVLQKACMIADRPLRPALVTVAQQRP